ncbi:MAG TPA: O-methyltransferase [Mycobacterium sp.]|nr:O-methyltransferase [Mycobacterium sp.]
MRVNDPDPQALDAMLGELLHTEDDVLAAARTAADAAGMPRIEVSAQHAKLLSLLATITHATRVLEIGTLAGYSTIALARGVGPGGRVVTLECEHTHAEVARANLVAAGVDARVEIIVGAALDTLPRLAVREERFDMFFIDADKENNAAYVQWAVELATPGAVIVIDNIARSGRVLDPAPDDLQARAVKEMFAMMGDHPALDTAAIQTVGTKGWDGFAIAVVRN